MVSRTTVTTTVPVPVDTQLVLQMRQTLDVYPPVLYDITSIIKIEFPAQATSHVGMGLRSVPAALIIAGMSLVYHSNAVP